MYESFFGLRDKPFNVTPDPRYLYLSDSHEEALSALLYGIRERKGLVTLTGPVGVGKTTVLFSFFQRVERVAEIAFFPGGLTGSRADLFRELCKQFTLPTESGSLFDLTRALKAFTARKLQENRNVIVLVDEAQDLGLEELNHFRYLNNLETPEAKFLQIVLAGMPELDENLRDPKLLSLRQRVAIRCTIQPLDPQSSIEYVLHRLRVAGSASDDLFTLEALGRIVNHAQGIPRRINVLCDNAMIIAFSLKKSPVEEVFVMEALEGLGGEFPEADRVPFVSPEEVAALYDTAIRRLGERDASAGEGERGVHAAAGRPGTDRGMRDVAPGEQEAALPRTASIGYVEGVAERRYRRNTAVIALLAVGGVLLLGLLLFLFRSPDPADEPGPSVPGPTGSIAERLEATVAVSNRPAPLAGSSMAGLRSERPGRDPVHADPGETVSEESDIGPAGLSPSDEPTTVPAGTPGLAAIAGAVYGTLTLEVLEDLAARNPDVVDWNRVETPQGLHLPRHVSRPGEPVDFFSVQVASFRQERSILKTAVELCAEGDLNLFVMRPRSVADDGGLGTGWYRCCAGVFASASDAQAWRDRIRRAGFPDAFVVRVRGVPLADIHLPCP